MNVAIYSLTRDRLDFTKHCFASLREQAGYPFDHYVLDNGSQDGSPEWLKGEFEAGRIHRLVTMSHNVGISRGSNLMLDAIFGRTAPDYIDTNRAYDLIIKVDNDCEIATADVLAKMVKAFEDRREFGAHMALSPRVDGIRNQPTRVRTEGRGGYRVGLTGIIGGLFQAVPASVYRHYRFPEDLPLAAGQDDHFCAWLIKKGVLVGYVEDLIVRHYLSTDGQAKVYPDYFKRKWEEEKRKP